MRSRRLYARTSCRPGSCSVPRSCCFSPSVFLHGPWLPTRRLSPCHRQVAPPLPGARRGGLDEPLPGTVEVDSARTHPGAGGHRRLPPDGTWPRACRPDTQGVFSLPAVRSRGAALSDPRAGRRPSRAVPAWPPSTAPSPRRRGAPRRTRPPRTCTVRAVRRCARRSRQAAVQLDGATASEADHSCPRTPRNPVSVGRNRERTGSQTGQK